MLISISLLDIMDIFSTKMMKLPLILTGSDDVLCIMKTDIIYGWPIVCYNSD